MNIFFFSDQLTRANGDGLKIMRGQRGKIKIVNDGFSFIKNKSIKDKIYWNCSQAKFHKCKARIITGMSIMDDYKVTESSHNHQPDIDMSTMVMIQITDPLMELVS